MYNRKEDYECKLQQPKPKIDQQLSTVSTKDVNNKKYT